MKEKHKKLKGFKVARRNLSRKNKIRGASKYYILSEHSGFPTADYFLNHPDTMIIMQQEDNTSSWPDH
ncbi:MAG: hypothetical protein GX088_02160 [Clostridia bacterium]|nr:hypothetical protein [Clostridia bacterium]